MKVEKVVLLHRYRNSMYDGRRWHLILFCHRIHFNRWYVVPGVGVYIDRYQPVYEVRVIIGPVRLGMRLTPYRHTWIPDEC
jgi:hypothetical protein